MTTDDPFDLQFRATLRAALDDASGPHPVWAEAPARRTVERPSGRTLGRRGTLRLLAVAALLAIGGGAAVLVGSSRAPEREFIFATPGPIPEHLVGEWLRDESPLSPPSMVLDLGRPPGLVPDEYGDATVRRATGYLPIDGDHGVIVLAATSQCPEARYLVSGVSEGQLHLERLMDSCPGSVALSGRAWTKHRVTLPKTPPAGARQASLAFTEPFHFPVVPSPDVIPVLLGQGSGLGRMWIGNAYWRGWFLDDQALYRDMTNPEGGALADLPATAAELEGWLRANGKLAASAPIELIVDGRTAIRFDTVEQGGFVEWPPGRDAADDRVDFGVANRFYLIPTGDDTIVFHLRADTPAEEDWAEELLKKITFD